MELDANKYPCGEHAALGRLAARVVTPDLPAGAGIDRGKEDSLGGEHSCGEVGHVAVNQHAGPHRPERDHLAVSEHAAIFGAARSFQRIAPSAAARQ